MGAIYCTIPHFLAYKGLRSSNSSRIRFIQAEVSKYEILIPLEETKINTSAIWLKNCTLFDVYDGHKSHCYMADKTNRLLEPQSDIHQIWMGSHLEKDGYKLLKMKMAALISQKLIMSSSILFMLCLGSELGSSRSRNLFM